MRECSARAPTPKRLWSHMRQGAQDPIALDTGPSIDIECGRANTFATMRALLIALLLCIPFAGATQSATSPTFATWQFALSLASTSDGQLFSVFIVKVYDGQVVESQPLSRSQFFRQVQGRTFSKANQDADDLFRTYDLRRCTLSKDSMELGYFLTDCSAFDDLWKLRFQDYPLKTQEGQQESIGWSEMPMKPSDRQMLLLGGYGMKYPMDLVIGENMFRLLHDLGDPEWVANYKGGL